MRVLVVNAGSSSVKLRLLDSDDAVAEAYDLSVTDGTLPTEALTEALEDIGDVDAVGHRVVHGGEEFTRATMVDGNVVARLRALAGFAPVHQPASLAGIELLDHALENVPAVACFDTAFHATLSRTASTYALPERWRHAHGLRRFGFHGISHSYATHRVTELMGGAPGRLVVAHLGAGASLAAVYDQTCVDTTMGFTPMEGLVMAERPGSVDPGLLLWLLRHGEMSVTELAHGLEHESGLVGLAGTSDMRAVVNRASWGEERAELGLAVYVHRLRGAIAAMAAALGGIDTLVFTGGVGENSATVRATTASELEFLGVELDADANSRVSEDTRISPKGADVGVWRITSREDLWIADEVRRLLTSA